MYLQNFVLIQPRTSPPKNCEILKKFANFARLAAVQFIETVPKSASGKILRKNLRKMEEEAGGKVFA